MVIFSLCNASQALSKHFDSSLWHNTKTYKIFSVGLILLSTSMTGCVRDESLPFVKQNTIAVVKVSNTVSAPQTAYRAACSKIKPSESMPWRIKISANLLCAETKSRLANIPFVDMAAQMGMVIVKGGVTLDVTTSRLDTDVQKRFVIKGVTITFTSVKYNRLSLIIRNPAVLNQLARIPEVRMIMPEYGGKTR